MIPRPLALLACSLLAAPSFGLPLNAKAGEKSERAEKDLEVLLVNGRASKEPAGRATFYLNLALDPFEGKPPPNRSRIRTRVIDTASFSKLTIADIKGYDCVFLCDLPRPSPTEARVLEAFVRNGGGVVFCLGPQVNAEAYNANLYREGKGLLPAKVLGRRKPAEGRAYRFGFVADTFEHPPLAKFSDDLSRESLRRPAFSAFVDIEKPHARSKARTVLTWEEYTPDKETKASRVGIALLEWRPFATRENDRTGRVVVLSTTVDTRWGNLPITPGFVSIAHQLARFVTDRPAAKGGKD